MEIAHLFKQYAVFNPELKRRDIEQMFTDRLNKERAPGMKPLSASFVAWKMKFSGLNKKNDLVAFYQMCDSAKNFSKYWWWSQKVTTTGSAVSTNGTMESGVVQNQNTDE